MNPDASRPLTPCVKICVIDEESGLCIGCGRSVEEIALWRDLDDDDRRAVMKKLPDRLATARAGSQRLARTAREAQLRTQGKWR